MQHFGEHYTADCYLCDYKALDDPIAIKGFLEETVEKLKMNKLDEPFIYKVENNSQKDPGGYSAFVIIMESHISIHTFVKRRFATIDVYSCKQVNAAMVRKLIKKYFKPQEIEEHFLKRGLKYPQENLIE